MKTFKPEKVECLTSKLFSIIWKKWVLLILKSINDWCKAYSEIEKNLEWINPRILSSRLKELQTLGFVKKKTISKEPLKFIYCLTNKWESFSEHINLISVWTKKWMIK